MNSTKLYTTHPSINRDEFKPVKINHEWKFKSLRWMQGDGVQTFVMSKVEDGPGESFALWVFSAHIPHSAYEPERVQIAHAAEQLDQATIRKIEKRPDGAEFGGCDFVISED
ncbi:MAG TPA: hypothetical protein VFC44_25835 [Candidatus Saccharimonadales bacterium]|nr:hypothetical protein [Candidatus Saccharimonadales bacterium]